jgi:hypothetical protein
MTSSQPSRTVADYAVLRDEPVEVGAGNPSFETTPWFRPSNFVAGTNLAKAILAFKVQALPITSGGTTFAPSMTYNIRQITVPSVVIDRGGPITSDMVHARWETFPATGFGQNLGTSFLFTVNAGRARFSDIILWYQVRL